MHVAALPAPTSSTFCWRIRAPEPGAAPLGAPPTEPVEPTPGSRAPNLAADHVWIADRRRGGPSTRSAPRRGDRRRARGTSRRSRAARRRCGVHAVEIHVARSRMAPSARTRRSFMSVELRRSSSASSVSAASASRNRARVAATPRKPRTHRTPARSSPGNDAGACPNVRPRPTRAASRERPRASRTGQVVQRELRAGDVDRTVGPAPEPDAQRRVALDLLAAQQACAAPASHRA